MQAGAVIQEGLAKPDRFSGTEENFLYWRTRIESFLVASMLELEEVLGWTEEFHSEITKTDIPAAWGPANPSHKTIVGIERRSLWSEVQEKRGLESWRRLLKRWDPSTGGRRRAMNRLLAKQRTLEQLEMSTLRVSGGRRSRKARRGRGG